MKLFKHPLELLLVSIFLSIITLGCSINKENATDYTAKIDFSSGTIADLSSAAKTKLLSDDIDELIITVNKDFDGVLVIDGENFPGTKPVTIKDDKTDKTAITYAIDIQRDNVTLDGLKFNVTDKANAGFTGFDYFVIRAGMYSSNFFEGTVIQNCDITFKHKEEVRLVAVSASMEDKRVVLRNNRIDVTNGFNEGAYSGGRSYCLHATTVTLDNNEFICDYTDSMVSVVLGWPAGYEKGSVILEGDNKSTGLLFTIYWDKNIPIPEAYGKYGSENGGIIVLENEIAPELAAKIREMATHSIDYIVVELDNAALGGERYSRTSSGGILSEYYDLTNPAGGWFPIVE